jgi:Tfp pilus assembly protein PilO
MENVIVILLVIGLLMYGYDIFFGRKCDKKEKHKHKHENIKSYPEKKNNSLEDVVSLLEK